MEKKILYVCPLAHCGGHRPSAILTETTALSAAGFNVALLTYNGLLGGEMPRVPRFTAVHQNNDSPFLNILLCKSTFHLFEQLTTIVRAVLLLKNLRFDVIYLRDGDPFPLFILFSNFFLKKKKWIVQLIQDPRRGVVQRLNYSKIWRPLFRHMLLRNRFVFTCENDLVKKEYGKCMGGVLSNNLVYLPLMTKSYEEKFSKEQAKSLLDLPIDKYTLLSFGSLHSGKDVVLVAQALKDMTNACLVIAGKVPRSLHDIIISINPNTIIRNAYIQEKDKPLYYAASDCVVLSYYKKFLERQSGAILWDTCKFDKTIVYSNGGQLGKLATGFDLGIPFEPEDIISLRKAIAEIRQLNNLRLENIALHRKKFIDRFSVMRWAKYFEKIYNYLNIAQSQN